MKVEDITEVSVIGISLSLTIDDARALRHALKIARDYTVISVAVEAIDRLDAAIGAKGIGNLAQSWQLAFK